MSETAPENKTVDNSGRSPLYRGRSRSPSARSGQNGAQRVCAETLEHRHPGTAAARHRSGSCPRPGTRPRTLRSSQPWTRRGGRGLGCRRRSGSNSRSSSASGTPESVKWCSARLRGNLILEHRHLGPQPYRPGSIGQRVCAWKSNSRTPSPRTAAAAIGLGSVKWCSARLRGDLIFEHEHRRKYNSRTPSPRSRSRSRKSNSRTPSPRSAAARHQHLSDHHCRSGHNDFDSPLGFLSEAQRNGRSPILCCRVRRLLTYIGWVPVAALAAPTAT